MSCNPYCSPYGPNIQYFPIGSYQPGTNSCIQYTPPCPPVGPTGPTGSGFTAVDYLHTQTLPTAPYNIGQTGCPETSWTPYYSTCDVNPESVRSSTSNLCATNGYYNVYLAKCDLSDLSGFVGVKAVKVLDSANTSQCAATVTSTATADIFRSDDEIICIIEAPGNPPSFVRPCFISNHFFTLWPSLEVAGLVNTNNAPLVTKMNWSATSGYLLSALPPLLTTGPAAITSIQYLDYTQNPPSLNTLSPLTPSNWGNIRLVLNKN